MQEYAIQRSSRRCYATNRPLSPGERYYSTIIQKGSDLVRRDFSAENWPGPHSEMIGWWISTIPIQANRTKMAPPQVLVDTLIALLKIPRKESLAYFLALQLLRRRILTEPTVRPDETQSGVLRLRYAPDDRELLIPVEESQDYDFEELQSQLFELLYSEA